MLPSYPSYAETVKDYDMGGPALASGLHYEAIDCGFKISRNQGTELHIQNKKMAEL